MNFTPKSKPVEHPRLPEKIMMHGLRFIGEQDGSVERELKSLLIQFFNQDNSIERAYLAKVVYFSDSSHAVALCLKTESENNSMLAGKIGKIFSGVFRHDQFMDAIFLTDAQERELSGVCSPFFARGVEPKKTNPPSTA
jgi:hypothetical protein